MGVKRADPHDVFRVMTPGQNGPSFWERAIRHNPNVCQAFEVWATHPYPESYPPHYNHHDGVPYINQVKTIDSYLLDLDAVARVCDEMGSPRRGFPVMITETTYGDHLGIAYGMGSDPRFFDGVTAVGYDEWHHVAAVYDGATMLIYLDGALDNSVPTTEALEISDANVLIGTNPDEPGRYWDGLIDEVLIYNRALSETEIASLAQ